MFMQTRSLRSVLTALLAATSLTAAAQANPADNCNTVDVSPFPAAADQPQTVHVRRYCPNTSPFLETVQAERSGATIRVTTRCRQTPLLLFTCQIGQADLPGLEPGDYTLEVYALENGALLWDDQFSVGVTAVIPVINGWGIGLLALGLLALGGATLGRQSGLSRFSNKRR
jgi:hypothetical protein